MSPEQKTRVTEMWKEGFTYKEIAANIDSTRSAVAGHCHRHGMRRDYHPHHVMPRQQQQQDDEPKPQPPRVVEGVGFMQLSWQHCRVVIGTGKDGLALYCGEAKSFPTSFCDYHRQQLMYRRPGGFSKLPRWMRS